MLLILLENKNAVTYGIGGTSTDRTAEVVVKKLCAENGVRNINTKIQIERE